MNKSFSQYSLIEYGNLSDIDFSMINKCRGEHNRYFWDTIYGELPWEKDREQEYLKLELPSEFDILMNEFKGEYHRVATHASNSLPTNDFVTIKEGKFHFSKDDALVILPEVVRLRKLIQSRMPAVRIEKLLA